MPRPRVMLIGLGGTIAMSADAGAVVPALGAAQLVAAVPGLAGAGVDVEVLDFRQTASASLSFDDLLGLAAVLDALDGVDGIVVTQGTDSMEETAYLLDLAYRGDTPVVMTGAMRAASAAGADGPANLLAAVRVAVSPQARGRGVLVVMADEIHAAVRVRKTHTTGVAAFRSPGGGVLGQVTEGRVRFVNAAARGPGVPLPALDPRRPRVRVALLTMALGDDGTLAETLLRDDAWHGAVIAGFGGGHVPAGVVPVLRRLAARMPVVLASRTGEGDVLTSSYGYPGGEVDLLGAGLIPAGPLDPLKARVLLHLLLSAGVPATHLPSAFTATADPSTAASPPLRVDLGRLPANRSPIT
ncbi:asparaginase [Catenuloplanes atrovinosus]|uniref:L-asparaginase n=1 Tax=Catenuloplanes atrovinosus TaxID=137266 RepID=A0AAE3YL18_9ACTN|nr:asparaginase [Catenuloplanes atrovinosus]MDR7275779.1 L-asparaginase [Catenuloplanes atrovinosus]